MRSHVMFSLYYTQNTGIDVIITTGAMDLGLAVITVVFWYRFSLKETTASGSFQESNRISGSSQAFPGMVQVHNSLCQMSLCAK